MVEGRLRVDGHLSRTGIQIYWDGPEKRREYRPPEEVFDGESLGSLRAMPVTIRHPKVFVDGDNWKDYSVGFVGDSVEKSDDEKHTTAPVWIIDKRAQKLVLDGKLKELSVGYTAELEMLPGVIPGTSEKFDAIQRNIRGNHLALLPVGQARGGRSVALRLDSQGHAIFDDDDERDGDPSEGDPEMAKKITIRADGYDYVGEFADDKVEQAIRKDQDAAKAKSDGLEAKIGELEAKLAESEKKVDGLKTELADATDPAKLEAAAEARKAFDEKLLLVAGEGFDRESIKVDGDAAPTDVQIMAAALEARGIKVEDATDARIEGRFLAEADIAKDRKHDAVDRARESVHNHNRSGEGRADSQAVGFSLDKVAREFGG